MAARTGTGMQRDKARIRFAPMNGSRSALNDRIVEVRKLLRTNLYLILCLVGAVTGMTGSCNLVDLVRELV